MITRNSPTPILKLDVTKRGKLPPVTTQEMFTGFKFKNMFTEN